MKTTRYQFLVVPVLVFGIALRAVAQRQSELVPTPIPTATATPLPTATATPTPDCQYQIDFKWVNDPGRQDRWNFMFRPSGFSDVSKLTSLSCMQQIFCDCYVYGRDAQGNCDPTKEYFAGTYSEGGNPLSAGLEYLVDECIAIKLGDLKSPGYCGTFEEKHWKTLIDKQRCRQSKGNTHGCYDNNPIPDFSPCRVTDQSSYVILDGQCKAVTSAAANWICGKYEAWAQWSPISLLWERDSRRSKSLVRFPLNPNSIDKVYEWHGSASMPLLVYDPSHTGDIRSGSQLFGNWTWGGKRSASLAGSAHVDSAWKHGFEALAELDSNHNGKVDGAELDPLGLWFDRNQDGASQKGEVVSATSAGVTALFYTPDDNQPNPQEVMASVGFERTTNGQVIKGAAVDWFAREARSKGELALHQQLLNLNEPLTNDYLEKMLQDERNTTSSGALAGNDQFAGAWRWKVRDDSAHKERGTLFGTLVIITNPGQPEVSGHSVIELPLITNSPDKKAPRSVLARSSVRGTFQRTMDGLELVLSVVDGKKVIALSDVRLSQDGKKLLGTTITGENEQHGSLSYEWEAERY